MSEVIEQAGNAVMHHWPTAGKLLASDASIRCGCGEASFFGYNPIGQWLLHALADAELARAAAAAAGGVFVTETRFRSVLMDWLIDLPYSLVDACDCGRCIDERADHVARLIARLTTPEPQP